MAGRLMRIRNRKTKVCTRIEEGWWRRKPYFPEEYEVVGGPGSVSRTTTSTAFEGGVLIGSAEAEAVKEAAAEAAAETPANEAEAPDEEQAEAATLEEVEMMRWADFKKYASKFGVDTKHRKREEIMADLEALDGAFIQVEHVN